MSLALVLLADETTWIPVVAVVLAVAALASVALLVAILHRVGHLAEGARRGADADAKLDEIAAAAKALASAHAELDLRRIEHALYDIRDGQKRVEDRVLAGIEARHGSSQSASAIEPASQAIATTLPERIVTRMLALGYERIQFVTPVADVQRISNGDGEVAVEARRDGAACKGRVLVRGGAIADLQLQSAYSIFP